VKTVGRRSEEYAELTPHALQAALALAEICFLREDDESGGRVIDPQDARFFLSGQMGAWSLWRGGVPAPHIAAIDTLLRYRPRRLAKESGFRLSMETRLRRGIMPRYELREDGFLRIVGGVPAEDVLAAALAELEAAGRGRRRVPDAARGGQQYVAAVYLNGPDGHQEFRRNSYWIPDADVPQDPLRVVPASAPESLTLSYSALLDTAKRIDDAGDHGFSLHGQLGFFLDGLRGPGTGASRLEMDAGPLNLLVAPTGTGKSILTRVAASELAQRGNVVVVLVPDVESTLSLVCDIRADAAALGVDMSVVSLMSPRRLIEVARRRSDEARDDERARWTWSELGYSCLLPIEEGPDWQPGQEPCTDLAVSGEEEGRYRCPFIPVCEKWRPWRLAAETAQVIVTNHAYFQKGSVPIPTAIDGNPQGRVSVQEFLLKRADVVVIDEIDAFQASAVRESGRTLTLARRGEDELLLEQLNKQRQQQVRAGTVPRELELEFQRVIKRLDYLPERYLSAVVNGLIDPSDPVGRAPARLPLPRRWDNLLACRLFGLDELEERPDDDQLDVFGALFQQPEPSSPLPPGWDGLRQTLRLVVSQAPAADHIEHARDQLTQGLAGLHDGAGVQNPEQTAHLLLRRGFLDEIQRDLAALERLLPLMRDSGMRLAEDVETALDRGSAWHATPEGPIGRSVFGFAVTGDVSNAADRTLSAEIIAGDPHAYTAELGMTTAAALTGAPRIVLGLSATAFLPGAPTFHVHSPVKWYFPDRVDAGTGKVTIRNAAVSGIDGRGIVFSGTDQSKKPQVMREIGSRLWEQVLEEYVETLHRHPDPARRQRARVLLVTNSYKQETDLCRGLIKAGARRSRICLAMPATADGAAGTDLQFPDDVHLLPANRLRDFPGIAGADILISPFARVARGLNIVVENKSALDSIWVCVRPVRLINDPSALVAHTGAHSRAGRKPSDDPARELALRHQAAAIHLEHINRANPEFSRLPREVRTAVFADIFADLNQLAGRARRGGTDTTLYLVDNAFHADGTAPGSDFASLYRNLHALWAASGDLPAVREIFGTTLDAFATFAHLPRSGNR
jgi:hypothetical protein